MQFFRVSIQSCLLGVLVCVGGCTGPHIVQREVLSLTGGGSGESWIVVHEVEGNLGERDVDSNRYVIYQCVRSGCSAVSTLPGSEKRR